MARQEGAQEGRVVTLVAPYAVLPGAGVLVGMLFGVATGGGPPNTFPAGAACAIGASIEVEVVGAFPLVKTAGAAWTQGMAIYWDNTNKKAITVATANKFIGYAVDPAASADVVGMVLLANSKDVVG